MTTPPTTPAPAAPLPILLTHAEADWIDAFETTSKAAYENSRAHGFWDTLPRNRGEMLMLIVTEVAEAMEGIRKGAMDDHLPHRSSLEVELADVIVRVMDFSAGHGLDVGGAVVEKMRYNATRPARHGKRF